MLDWCSPHGLTLHSNCPSRWASCKTPIIHPSGPHSPIMLIHWASLVLHQSQSKYHFYITDEFIISWPHQPHKCQYNILPLCVLCRDLFPKKKQLYIYCFPPCTVQLYFIRPRTYIHSAIFLLGNKNNRSCGTQSGATETNLQT